MDSAMLMYFILFYLTVTYGLPLNNDKSHSLKRKPDSQLPVPDEELYSKPEAFEFDMVLNEQQRDAIEREVTLRHRFGGLIDGLKRKMVANGIYKWPHAIIPFQVHPGINGVVFRNLLAAIKEWHSKTCIRFMLQSTHLSQTVGHLDYVLFYPQSYGCGANVGRWGIGQQHVNLSMDCRTGSIVHELGHVIGFVHEQSRPDRDENVDIIYDNIRQDKRKQFEKYSRRYVDPHDIPYDIGSIMHYGSKAFSKASSLSTIKTSDHRIQMWMGQRNNLTFLDAKLANKAYGCHDHCTVPDNCKNGGYIGPACVCVCPDGLTGPTCEDVLSSSGCGQVLNQHIGIIQSKNYPKNYSNDDSCYWFIKGPTHSTIHLTFVEFETEDDVNCAYDYIELRVYGPQKVGQRYCGNETGTTITHNSNTLLLHFRSDWGFNFKGFRILYRIIT